MCPESSDCLHCEAALPEQLDASFCTSFFHLCLITGCDILSAWVPLTVRAWYISVSSEMFSACVSCHMGFESEPAELPVTLLQAQEVLGLAAQLAEGISNGTAAPASRHQWLGGLFDTAVGCRNSIHA